MHLSRAVVAAFCLLAGSPALAQSKAKAAADDDVLLKALTEELNRSMTALKGVGAEKLYYLSYRVNDGRWFQDSASYGALENNDSWDEGPLGGRARFLDVSARVGSYALDNTHKLRGDTSFDFERFRFNALPIENDLGALRLALWKATDRAYRSAAKQLTRVKTNLAVKVTEEDRADDFSKGGAPVHLEPVPEVQLDRKAWKDRLKRLSALFKQHPAILSSSVSLQGGGGTSYFVDSEGARLRVPRFFVRVMITGGVRADDGMELSLYDDLAAASLSQLPTEAELEARVKRLITRLEALRTAPVIEPFTGPAIVANRAAAVFFHEILGHRVEGHRQKDADEGRTFTKKLGQGVIPEFISVVDDPTKQKFGDTVLNGHYLYDDEGVAAQRAPLVERGVLKGFLQGRSPIPGFPRSNGHGRAQPGLQPVARQGNLFVESARQVPFEKLRAQLIDEVKRRNKPYGLIFEDVSGGFTFTQTGMLPQAFKVMPLWVTRVYPDGRKDELVRGVDIVGTPLASFEKILATGDDFAVFNGYCGAESGSVPVSAIAPSLLIGEIEVEKRGKGYERPPLLSPPLTVPSAVAKDQR